jgi:hypothetical protein
MNGLRIRLICLLVGFLLSVCCNADVMIVVEEKLYEDSQVKDAVALYAKDIENARGVNVAIKTFASPKNGGTAEALKELLVKNREGLQGAIFVGDLPRALFEFPQWNNDGFRYQRWASDFYFMDMDGVWLDTASGWFGMTDGKITEEVVLKPAFSIGSASPLPGTVPVDSFSIRYEGFIKPPQTGLCSLEVISDNGRRVFIGDTLVVDAWLPDWSRSYYGAVNLVKDSLYAFRLEYEEEYGSANLSLYWKWESGSWEEVPKDVWFHGNPVESGLLATFYGNIGLKDSVEHPGEPTGWKSGAGNGVYDAHYSTRRDSVSDSLEIWVSRIDPNTAGLLGSPKDLLLKWFDKVHASYGKKTFSNKAAYFMVPGTDLTVESNYKFVRGLSALYGESAVDIIESDSLKYVQSIAQDYDWSIYVGHSNHLGLGLGFNARDVRYPMEVGPRIFHFASCGPLLAYDDVYGNTYSISVASAHLFGTSGGGLVSVGSTKTSGDNQLDDLMYEYAAEGVWIGEAFRRWLNERIKRNRYWPRENIYDWFYGESMVGDPMQVFGTHATDALPRKKAWRASLKKHRSYDASGRLIQGRFPEYKVRFFR